MPSPTCDVCGKKITRDRPGLDFMLLWCPGVERLMVNVHHVPCKETLAAKLWEAVFAAAREKGPGPRFVGIAVDRAFSQHP